jgi:hypothetical protein
VGEAIVGIALYLLPAIVACTRAHQSALAIFLLNLLLGWTVLGWIVALVWAATAVRGAGATEAVRTCPCCAEAIQPEAVKCKHCGEALSPWRAGSGTGYRTGRSLGSLMRKD